MSGETHGKFTVGGFYYHCAFAPPWEPEPRIGIETVVFEGLVERPEKAVKKGEIPKYYTFRFFRFGDRNAKQPDGYDTESLKYAELSTFTINELIEVIADLEQQIRDMRQA